MSTNEPFAWHMEDEKKTQLFYRKQSGADHATWIPLYTTPQTRPLAKERYMAIWENVVGKRTVASFVTEFVREIEKEHGIK